MAGNRIYPITNCLNRLKKNFSFKISDEVKLGWKSWINHLDIRILRIR